MEKCDRLQEYNLQLEKQVIPLQTQVAKLQKELGSSFKSTMTLTKKNDNLNATLSTVHGKLRQEISFHASEVVKFRSVIGRLEEDLARAQKEFEAAKQTAMAEYK